MEISPDFGILGVPGLGLGRGLAVEHHRGMRHPLAAIGRRLGARNGMRGSRGGSMQRSSLVRPRLHDSERNPGCKRDRRSGRGLLRLLFELGCRAGALASSSGGEVDAALVEGSLRGFSGLLGSTGQHVGFLQRSQGGQEGHKSTDGEKSRRRSNLTSGRCRRKSGEAGTGLRGKELGELPGHGAELLRESAGARE